MMFTQKLRNASIEKLADAGAKRRYSRLFSKRAKSVDRKYTLCEVPSISTNARHRQTQRMMAIVEKNFRMSPRKIAGVEKHRLRLLNIYSKGQRATDIDALWAYLAEHEPLRRCLASKGYNFKKARQFNNYILIEPIRSASRRLTTLSWHVFCCETQFPLSKLQAKKFLWEVQRRS